MKSVLREGILARIKPQFLSPYLSRRVDYSSAGIEMLTAVNGQDLDMPEVPRLSTEMNGTKHGRNISGGKSPTIPFFPAHS